MMNVVCEGEHSESVSVESGVPRGTVLGPRGTVLGPLMFLCHINDLPDCVKSQLIKFFSSRMTVFYIGPV